MNPPTITIQPRSIRITPPYAVECYLIYIWNGAISISTGEFVPYNYRGMSKDILPFCFNCDDSCMECSPHSFNKDNASNYYWALKIT